MRILLSIRALFTAPEAMAGRRATDHEAYGRPLARIFLSAFSFAFKMIVSLIALAYAAISFPVTIRDLLTDVQQFRDEATAMLLPDTYQAWADIALWPSLILFAGFATAVHAAMDLTRAIFNNWRFPGEADTVNPAADQTSAGSERQ
jgi:hypothetical protein